MRPSGRLSRGRGALQETAEAAGDCQNGSRQRNVECRGAKDERWKIRDKKCHRSWEVRRQESEVRTPVVRSGYS